MTKQEQIAKALGYSHSTVVYTLKQVWLIRDQCNQIKVKAGQVVCQTRILLFIHRMELWDKVKGYAWASSF